MLSFMIVVNDNGELKSIHQHELTATNPVLNDVLELDINKILDARSEAEGMTDELDNFEG